MTAQELLPIFEQAVEDWRKPVELSTCFSLAWYLANRYPKTVIKFAEMSLGNICKSKSDAIYFISYNATSEQCRNKIAKCLKLIVHGLKQEIK